MNTKKRLILFWKIGKCVFDERNKFDNVVDRYSVYCQYKYGLTECFSRENVHFMRRLYIFFPIFNEMLLKLEWEHYLELLKISDTYERMFYYKMAVFCNSSISELKLLINNCCYERI